MNRTVIKILKIQFSDSSSYFAALKIMKNGSYKGLQVTHYHDKKKPEKAKQSFVQASDVVSNPENIGWHQISPNSLPSNVQARFAEAA